MEHRLRAASSRDPGTPGVEGVPTAMAVWALRDAVSSFLAQCDEVDIDATFEHGDWGHGLVADGIRWIGHEFVHHQLDVDERAVET